MSNGLISFDSVLAMIIARNFGAYILTNLPGTDTLSKSHLSDEDPDMDSVAIVADLQEKMMHLGTGNYKLLLKTKNKAPNNSGLTLRFYYRSDLQDTTQPQQQSQQTQFAGLGMAEMDNRIEKAVAREVEHQRELSKLQAEIQQQKFELMMEKAKAKETTNTPPAWLESMFDSLKVIAAGVVAKVAPEAMPAINSMLAVGVEEETTKTVTRTD